MMEWQHRNCGPIASDQAMYSQPAAYNINEQISEILKTQYGIAPKRGAVTYAKPYPAIFDQMEVPLKFKIPDFSKFSGTDNTSSLEHVSRYLAQLGPLLLLST